LQPVAVAVPVAVGVAGRGPELDFSPQPFRGEAISVRTALRPLPRWACLIRQVYEVDPLLCSLCGATMKVIAVIEDEEVVYRILAHLNLLSPGDGPLG